MADKGRLGPSTTPSTLIYQGAQQDYNQVKDRIRSTHRLQPITFAIPENRIVSLSNGSFMAAKKKRQATVIPGKLNTYVFREEATYLQDYRQSWFGITHKKAGWDCMRHLEIMASGCLPKMHDLDHCPTETMVYYPKQMMALANQATNWTYEDRAFLIQQMVQYIKQCLSCKSLAKRVLTIVKAPKNARILFLDDQIPHMPDYQSNMLLLGLKQLVNPTEQLTVYRDCDYHYTDFPEEQTHTLYGRGFCYSRTLDPSLRRVDPSKEQLIQQLRENVFDVIVYGSIERSRPFWEEVQQTQAIRIFVDGEDHPASQRLDLLNDLTQHGFVFYRELDVTPEKFLRNP